EALVTADDAKKQEELRGEEKKNAIHRAFITALRVIVGVVMVVLIVRALHLILPTEGHEPCAWLCQWLSSDQINSIDKLGSGGIVALMMNTFARKLI
ncbi:hypothetical protein, partial [uncultured Akkermansia sp.]|uniref:hypothetical protein n=1 Tax=uncultured Akkermansia sp. TaxID=512294 RepID=UPI00265C9BB0